MPGQARGTGQTMGIGLTFHEITDVVNWAQILSSI